MKRIALVTGGNRGLGFETCRQLAKSGFTVLLTARDPDVDVTNKDHISTISKQLEQQFGRLDVLNPKCVGNVIGIPRSR